jgi:Ca2+-transporting ATPase
MQSKAYQGSIEKVIAHYKTDPTNGLSLEEVALRSQKYGPNKLPETPHDSILWVFISQFQSPLIYILLLAASIIFLLGDHLDAYIISGVLLFNACIGTIQEGRTRTILKSLQKYLKTNSIVIRNGKQSISPDEQLTVGDLIVLQDGEKVPADARIIESHNLHINESTLTGESLPVQKNTETITNIVPVHDQKNMVFKGTFVTSGFAHAIVTAIGTHTHIGELQQSVEEIETETPLKKSIDHLSHQILLFILGICVFLFGYGLLIGKTFNELLVMLTALFICVVPEGLPVVFTLALVTGAWNMAKHKVLIKRLQAVEGLGRITVAVIDKTGTLTRNEMMISSIVTSHNEYTVTGQGYKPQGTIQKKNAPVDISHDSTLQQIIYASALLSHAHIDYSPETNLFTVKGDPTEASLAVFAQKNNITENSLKKDFKPVLEIPFDSEYRYQISLFKHNSKLIAYLNGSPEVVFKHAGLENDQGLQNKLDTMLKQGLRVVALGMKTFPAESYNEFTIETLRSHLETDVTFLGLVGIEDSIRAEAQESVEKAREAGIKVVMATGDHKQTALCIARQVGITTNEENILTGSVIDKLSDTELKDAVANVDVCARVTPHQKLRVVQAFQARGETVAMTGDGVNDAPSLVAADLGIAMGSIGTEVAKQAADIILLDDSFKSIMNGVQEGRNIYFVLRRVILYFFTTNLGEVLIVLFALLLNLPLPILASQILWLNLITDGFLDVALSMEPQEPDLLSKEVRPTTEFIDKNMLLKMLYMSLPMGIVSLLVFHAYEATDINLARTMCLVTMAAFQWFNAWNCRSETRSVFTLGLFSNKWLIMATTLVLALQFLILNNTTMQFIFKTVPLNAAQWGLILAVTSPLFVVEELRKYIVRTYYK